MINAIQSQPAYLLHSRPYRDTSLLVDFITHDFGRVSAVAKGVRSPKSKSRALLQPFIPLQINLSGRSELKTLGQVDSLDKSFLFRHKALFAAMYLNELLIRLLHKQEADAEIYLLYEATLNSLSREDEIEPVLRSFELSLLDLLGYGIDFSVVDKVSTTDGGSLLFHYHYENGFEAVESTKTGSEKYYEASSVQLIARRDFSKKSTRNAAKRLLRSALSIHLGDKALSSRNLFRKNTR